MKLKLTNYLIISLSLFLLGIISNSCIDDSCDFSDIDKTINVGGEKFEIPLGSTKKLTVEDAIKDEYSDFLSQNENGEYFFSFSGNIDVGSSIPDFSIPNLSAQEISESFSHTFQNYGLQSVLSDEEPASFSIINKTLIFNIKSETINELSSVDSVYLSNAIINMGVNVLQCPISEGAHFEIEISFPKSFVFDDERVVDNKFTFTKVLQHGNLKLEDPLVLKAVNLGIDNIGGSLDVDESIQVSGKIFIDDESVFTLLQDKTIELTVNVGISESQIIKFVGKIDYSDNDISSMVDVGNVPDIFNDEDTNLDFSDSYLKFNVNSNLGIPVDIKAVLIPYYESVADNSTTVTIPISIPMVYNASEVSSFKYFIGDSNSNIPDDYNYIKTDLSELLSRVPDKVKLKIGLQSDLSENHVIYTDADYNINADYEFIVPLKFGKDLSLSVKDTLNDVSEELNDILENNDLSVKGIVTNSFPLSLHLELVPYDENGNIITNVNITPADIPACNSDLSAKESEVEMIITNSSNTKPKINFLKVNITINSSSEVCNLAITSSSFVQIKFSIFSKNGLTFNLDED